MKKYLLTFFKGIAMGAADVVPGVSGGTIAFITGIYDQLLDSINSVNKENILLLFKFKIKEFWTAVNGKFLFPLLSGIALSILTLAKLIEHLMTNEPILLWSFFFGLVVASVPLVLKKVTAFKPIYILHFIVGCSLAVFISLTSPTHGPDNLLYTFFCGSLAICAMILPGISGSFILVLLGAYHSILGSLNSLTSAIKDGNISEHSADLLKVIVFIFGAIVGLLSFARLLKWLFSRFHNQTIIVLAGFVAGSLVKIWPWKQVLEYTENRHGELIPLIEKNISPNNFLDVTQQEPQILYAVLLAILGFAIVWSLESFSKKADQ